uniref:Uncharacterized protein n=1 Tax=Arundo donax TaxID=35708 RepID=A0A0A9AJQ2_ARUDO
MLHLICSCFRYNMHVFKA